MVRPAWALTRRCKSSPDEATRREGNHNCVRVVPYDPRMLVAVLLYAYAVGVCLASIRFEGWRQLDLQGPSSG